MAKASEAPGSNTRYNDTIVFSFWLDLLLPGDVILMRNREGDTDKDRKQSTAISLLTRGSFSHAAICTLLPTAIEAVQAGVTNFTLANTFFHDPRNVRVLRYYNAAVAERAADKASWFLGQAYSVPLAVRSVLPNMKAADLARPETFCSALVAAAFVASQAPEFANINPLKVKPATLERMQCFEDMTSRVTRKILAPRNIEELSALDGERRLSPFAKQSKILRDIFEAIVPDLKTHIQAYDLRTDVPTSFFGAFDRIISDINWCADNPTPAAAQFKTDTLANDAKLHALMVESDFSSMLEDALQRDTDTMADLRERASQADPDVSLDDLEAALLQTYGQIKSRLETIEPPRCPAGRSAAWDYWVTITRRSVDNMRERQEAMETALKRLAPERLVRARATASGGDPAET